MAFDEIYEILRSATVGAAQCNYCEQNEAADIEHIWPKSLFPEYAFNFLNYILSCKTCNTTYKSNNCHIFDPVGSTISTNISPNNRNRIYSKPTNTDALWINLQLEDPTNYFRLLIDADLNKNKHMMYVPKSFDKSDRGYQKAKFVIEKLGLNTRKGVLENRQKAYLSYVGYLQKFVAVSKVTTFDQLVDATSNTPIIHFNNSLASEIVRFQQIISNDVKEAAHPTVWFELKRYQSEGLLVKINSTVAELFAAAPEALNW